LWKPKIQRTDGDYTNGIRVSLSRSVAPLWGRLIRSAAPCTGRESEQARCLTTEFALAQQMYTPSTAYREPSLSDRPFVGWLHADVTGNVVSAKRLTSFRIEAGFTGRATLAEALQRSFHAIAGANDDPGWKYQLGFAPLGALSYTDRLRVVLAKSHGQSFIDLLPTWSAQVGNSRTVASGEIAARAGFHLAHPWSLASRTSEGLHRFGVWFYGGFRESFVAYDETLDRSWSRDGSSYSVDRIPWVSGYQFGVAVHRHSLTITFGGNHDAREYETETNPHTYGSLTINVDHGGSAR
jgi:lipid A 3-O-deacylase